MWALERILLTCRGMSTQNPSDPLMDALVEAVTAIVPAAREGHVRGHTARYRRLDCDGRALAYLRPRTRPSASVRVDLSGLWVRPGPCTLEIAGRTGSASLLIVRPQQIAEAARYLAWAVANMRALLAGERARAVCAPRAVSR